MTMPSDGTGTPWQGPGPSQEFLNMFQAEMRRLAGENATGQPDPMTPMDAVWVSAHTLFESACRAGFTERQALIAVVEVMLRQA